MRTKARATMAGLGLGGLGLGGLGLAGLGLAGLGLVGVGACSRPPTTGLAHEPAEMPAPASLVSASPSAALPVVRPQPDRVVPRGHRPASAKKSCTDAQYQDAFTPGYEPDPRVRQQVQEKLARMSLSEKASQIRGTPKGTADAMNWEDIFRTPDDERNGIRGFRFRDGPRGVCLDSGCPEDHDCYSTVFPVAIARGATFDQDLERRIGRAMGDETLGAGHNLLLAPCINIVRHPAWGRTQETYGEDSFLLGKMGSAFIVGVQEYVPACAKHFVANNIEKNRRQSNSRLDEQTLREVYGAAYEMTVREAGVACVMASYNKVNGTLAGHNRRLLQEILREDFGFQGFVISDWWGLENALNADLAPAKYRAAAQEALAAGTDLEMPWALNYEQLESLVKQGKLEPTLVDTSAGRILEQKYRFKIASDPAGLAKPVTRLGRGGSIEGNEAHVELAYEAALESAVLLKNEGGTLPIDRGRVKTVAVLGAEVPYKQGPHTNKSGGTIDFARDASLGDLGSSRVNADPKESIGPARGIQMAAGPGVKVVAGRTAAAAKDADFVVVVAGLTPGDEGEEHTGAADRQEFGLDAKIAGSPQDDLIRAAIALKKPMAVVLVGGSVIDMPWLADVPAVVMSWYPGMVGGRALGDLLFGTQSFSGKLPLTWPNDWKELPEFDPGVPNDVPMGYFLGYRYYDQRGLEPLFPFGHGLSYTTFAYDNLEVPCSSVSKGAVVELKVDVINEGTRAAEEVAFLFVAYPDTQARRSIKELKGFRRVALEPGQAKQIGFSLPVASLRYWNVDRANWEVEAGRVRVLVGGSAQDLPLRDEFVVAE